MKICTGFWLKPIPDRRWDWDAVTDDYEPGDPIGYGRTEKEAIADLKGLLEDREIDTAEYNLNHGA